jgi:hypothetical protein
MIRHWRRRAASVAAVVVATGGTLVASADADTGSFEIVNAQAPMPRGAGRQPKSRAPASSSGL